MKNRNPGILNKGEIFNTRIDDESYNNLLVKFILFGLIVVSGYLIFFSPSHLSPTHIVLALCIIWCGFTPSILYLNDRNRPPFPFLPMFGVWYSIWYGFSVFNDELVFFGGQSQIRIKALVLILLGMICLFSCFYLSKKTLWKRVTPVSLPRKFPLNNLRILLWCLLFINIASMVSPTIKQLPSISQLFRPFGEIAFGTFFILWCRGNLSKTEASIIFLILFPIKFFLLLSTGLLTQPFFFSLFLLIVYWYEKKRVPFLMLTCFCIAFFIINPAKTEFRNLTWFGGFYQDSSFMDKTLLFGEVVYRYHFKKRNLGPKFQETKKKLNRFNHISEFSHVIELTPQVVPYWKGETYKGVFIKFIPRAIWPDKPTLPFGNIFGHRYGFIAPSDLNTAVNLQWTIEMYANFGIPGVIIGMGLAGMLLGFVEQKLNHSKMTFVEFIVGSAILSRIAYSEASLIEMFGSLFQISVAFYLIFQIGLRFKIR